MSGAQRAHCPKASQMAQVALQPSAALPDLLAT